MPIYLKDYKELSKAWLLKAIDAYLKEKPRSKLKKLLGAAVEECNESKRQYERDYYHDNKPPSKRIKRTPEELREHRKKYHREYARKRRAKNQT